MWDIQDFTGTLYSQHPTTLGHLMQTVYWLDNQAWKEFSTILPWEYHNIANCVRHDIQQWAQWYNVKANPIVEDRDFYCSTITSEYENVYQAVWSFMQILDLQLHDAAVTYTFLAAESNGDETPKQYAEIACGLWGYSRQLRVDSQRESVKDAIKNIFANMT